MTLMSKGSSVKVNTFVCDAKGQSFQKYKDPLRVIKKHGA